MRARRRRGVKVGRPDPGLTPHSGLAAVSELVEKLGVVEALDEAIGPIKQRARGLTGGELLVGMATAQLAGQDFLVGLDRVRADVAGQELGPVAGPASTTAAGLARRFTDGQWAAVETGLGAVGERMLALVSDRQRGRLTARATIDIDATDVEVYGTKKRGVAYNYQGQRCGRPHVATWAETETTLAAELMSGDQDPRSHATDVLERALAALPAQVRAVAQIALRADAGYFAGDLARAAAGHGIAFAIGAKRIAPLWRLLPGIAADAWTGAIDMAGTDVAVADYLPADWPPQTRLLIRRTRLDAEQVSADPRSRRRRTLHPDQRALPLEELAEAEGIYAYSFILTNHDVSSPARAAAVEHWYRHRTSIENVFRDSKLGAALRHLPSGYEQVNTAWMWGALIAADIAAWLHQLTATTGTGGVLAGHGTGDGKAMIATLRHRLINVPARLVRHAGGLVLRLPPGNDLLAEILARLRALPATS